MCEVLFDHWGYSSHDINYKSLPYILEEFIRTRACGCNFLLNIGPTENGSVRLLDKAYLLEIGKWIKFNKSFIYTAKPTDIKAENALVLKGEDGAYYAVSACPTRVLLEHESLGGKIEEVKLPVKIKRARWLDSGKPIKTKNGTYAIEAYPYGVNMCLRVAKLVLDI
jgi:alpha-L-fucosidase